jgi:hypothetical protein
VCMIFNDSVFTSLTSGVLIINLMLFGEIISLDCKNHTKHINTRSGQNSEFMNIKYVLRIVTTVV